MTYCVASDLYKYGLPRGALASEGRLVDSVDTSADSMELNSHGFADDDEVQFRPAGGGTLPTGIVAGTSYYAIAVDPWHFQVASTAGGDAIDLTAEGTTFAVYAPLPIASAIAKASRMIDDMLPAHVVPMESPYPDVVAMTCAELAASDLLAMTGGSSVTLTTVYDAARKRLERWSRGVPIRGDNAPSTAQRATITTTRTVSSWRTYGGTE